MNITDADREAVNSYLRGQMRRAFQGDADLHKQYLTEAFARHRMTTRRKALEDAAEACDAVQRRMGEDPDFGASIATKAIRAMIEGETE